MRLFPFATAGMLILSVLLVLFAVVAPVLAVPGELVGVNEDVSGVAVCESVDHAGNDPGVCMAGIGGVFDKVKTWMSTELLAMGVSLLATLLAAVLGVKYKKAMAVGKELAQLIDRTFAALEDGKVDTTEIKEIRKEFGDVVTAWRGPQLE